MGKLEARRHDTSIDNKERAVRTHVSLDNIGALVAGVHENPFELLGPHEVEHEGRRATAVRAYLPHSQQAWVLDPGHQTSRPMRRIHPAGVFEAICPLSLETTASYQLRVAEADGRILTLHDPYAFPTLLSDFDLYLFGQGTHWRIYEKLGAIPRQVQGIDGVNFAVWAPNAKSVSVVGDFNGWDSRRHWMRKHIPSGIWELFIPGLQSGDKYKFRLTTQSGESIEKADPFARAAELPPCTASVVADLESYAWHDQDWLRERRQGDFLHQPLSIYEVHLGSWQHDPTQPHGWLNYRELAHRLVAYCRQMGFTHLQLLPVTEHPFTGSWGYQTTGYYAATSRYGSPADLMYFVDYCHQHGIGVLLDWVPAHFPRDDHGLRRFDGSALFEHDDPRQAEHPDWGTLIFNYGRHEVSNFLVANALFWLDKYHIDGLRVDAVASMLYLDYSRTSEQWVPNRFGGRENLEAIDMLKQFNETAHQQFPGVLTIAEESTAWPGVSRPTYAGGLGFSLKWNMGWMNDTLRYMRKEPIHRGYHHDELTFSLIYAFHENFTLPLSHDEVVHGKRSLLDQMPGDLWQKFANLRLLYSYLWTHPGKKLLFMGGEIGQWNEWCHEAELQWDLLQWDTHQGLQRLVADLNAMYRHEPALHELDFDPAGFEWIDCHNPNDSVLVYRRKGLSPEQSLIVCCNFTPVVRDGYTIGVPSGGEYWEVFNSDSKRYDGSGIGNPGPLQATTPGAQGRPWQLQITLPPLATIVLKPQ